MKTAKELRELKTTHYNKELAELWMIPKGVECQFVSQGSIFLEDMTWEECKVELSRLRGILGKYEIANYYLSSGNLAIRYKFPKWEVLFYCTDVHEALEAVGKGKCEIVEKRDVSFHRTVKCNLR
ncbi:hypothetical protein N9064_00465 [bacterium]|nr:hypothetical protein [bacterium]